MCCVGSSQPSLSPTRPGGPSRRVASRASASSRSRLWGRFKRNVEYVTLSREETPNANEEEDGEKGESKILAGPRVAHRQYLTHAGVGPGTAYQRQQAAQRQRLSAAEESVFAYRLPSEAQAQRQHERRSRARLRAHDVIENRYAPA